MTRLEWVRNQCEGFRKALIGAEEDYGQGPVTSVELGTYDYEAMEKEVKDSLPSGSNAKLTFFWSNRTIARHPTKSRGLHLEGYRNCIEMPNSDVLKTIEFVDGYWVTSDPPDAEADESTD